MYLYSNIELMYGLGGYCAMKRALSVAINVRVLSHTRSSFHAYKYTYMIFQCNVKVGFIFIYTYLYFEN